MEQKDKRIYPRSETEFTVYVRMKSEGGEYKKTIGRDISATGLSFLSDHAYPVGTNLDLKLELIEMDKSIPIKTRIVRNFEDQGRKFSSVEVTEASEDDFVNMLDYSLEFLEGE